MNKILKFPNKFLWGSATSSYQVEGGIENCDWSKDFPAGNACDHYRRYEEDFNLLKKLNQNAYRFSIEWSRIEPNEGKFDKKEIEHYRKMLLSLKKKEIVSFVTLWHWTTPLWLSKKGGWANNKVIDYFTRYTKIIAEELGDLIDFWITINEPTVPFIPGYLYFGYFKGFWPPKKRNIFLALRAYKNFIKAHKKSYQIIHNFNKKARVGVALDCAYIEPYNRKSLLNQISVFIWRYLHNHLFFDLTKKYQDFLGINYYFHDRLKFPFSPRNENKIVSDLGWEIYPEGIYFVLKEMKKYQKPIYITENGIADAKDKLRKNFIKDHLYWIHRAIEEGVDVRGYLYWSLMDNYEWGGGFKPRFGLIEIDYEKNLERKIRQSAYYYAEICKKNILLQ